MATLQTTQANRNACQQITNYKTEKVNIFFLKFNQEISGSKLFGLLFILQYK